MERAEAERRVSELVYACQQVLGLAITIADDADLDVMGDLEGVAGALAAAGRDLPRITGSRLSAAESAGAEW